MKKLLLALSLVVSTVAFAQVDLEVRSDKFSLTIRGNGDFVCSAEETFSGALFLGRGETNREAQENAINLGVSVTGKNAMFVKIQSCERTESGRGRVRVLPDGTTIVVEGSSRAICYSKETFSGITYTAKAGTKTEASVLAKNACMSATGKNGMFCDMSCEKISAPRGGIVIHGIEIR